MGQRSSRWSGSESAHIPHREKQSVSGTQATVSGMYAIIPRANRPDYDLPSLEPEDAEDDDPTAKVPAWFAQSLIDAEELGDVDTAKAAHPPVTAQSGVTQPAPPPDAPASAHPRLPRAPKVFAAKGVVPPPRRRSPVATSEPTEVTECQIAPLALNAVQAMPTPTLPWAAGIGAPVVRLPDATATLVEATIVTAGFPQGEPFALPSASLFVPQTHEAPAPVSRDTSILKTVRMAAGATMALAAVAVAAIVAFAGKPASVHDGDALARMYVSTPTQTCMADPATARPRVASRQVPAAPAAAAERAVPRGHAAQRPAPRRTTHGGGIVRVSPF